MTDNPSTPSANPSSPSQPRTSAQTVWSPAGQPGSSQPNHDPVQVTIRRLTSNNSNQGKTEPDTDSPLQRDGTRRRKHRINQQKLLKQQRPPFRYAPLAENRLTGEIIGISREKKPTPHVPSVP